MPAISELLTNPLLLDQSVVVKGWIRTKRDSKAGFSFLEIHDGSAFAAIQAVAPNSLENYAGEILHLTTGCSVEVTGVLVKSEGKGQSVEIQASAVIVHGFVEDPETYPVSPKRHTFEYLRGCAHLRMRTNTFGAITRLRNCVAQSIHRFFHENGFYWVNTPIISTSDCEGAGELFQVSTLDKLNIPKQESGSVDYANDFFGQEAFLTVSGQLHLETHACAMSKVYTFGPTFRAENSNTSRHLAEFWMVEPEVAFADLQTMASLSEAFLKYIGKAVLDERADDMAFFTQRIDNQAISRLENIVSTDFAQMTYSEAIDVLLKANKKFEYPVSWGLDLKSEHERYLAEEYVGRPVILTDYPKEIKAFYMRLNDDEKTVAAMDLLAPGIGELIGGSQREERLEHLDARLDALSLKDELWWYRDLRRYGTVPHAGFGLGFERLLNYISGMENIRDVIPFPRTPRSASF